MKIFISFIIIYIISYNTTYSQHIYMDSRDIIIEDGCSITRIAKGCGKNFQANLTNYHLLLLEYLNEESAQLDYSLESLRLIDTLLIKAYHRNKEIPLNVFYGLLGYCGEVIRRETQGEWEIYRSDTQVQNKVVERYFPKIRDKNNLEYEYYGEVSKALDELPTPNLYLLIDLKLRYHVIKLPVVEIDPDEWFFPKLDDE